MKLSQYQRLRQLAAAEAEDDVETIDASEIEIVERAPRRPSPEAYEQARRFLVIDAFFELVWIAIWLVGAWLGLPLFGVAWVNGAWPFAIVGVLWEWCCAWRITVGFLTAKTYLNYTP